MELSEIGERVYAAESLLNRRIRKASRKNSAGSDHIVRRLGKPKNMHRALSQQSKARVDIRVQSYPLLAPHNACAIDAQPGHSH